MDGARKFGRKSFVFFTKNPQKTNFLIFIDNTKSFLEHLCLQTALDLSFFDRGKSLSSLQSEKTSKKVEKAN